MSDVEENGDCGRRCDEARPMTALSSDDDGRSGGMRFDAIEVEEMAARPKRYKPMRRVKGQSDTDPRVSL